MNMYFMNRSKLPKPVYSDSPLNKLWWSCPAWPIKRLETIYGSLDPYKKYTFKLRGHRLKKKYIFLVRIKGAITGWVLRLFSGQKEQLHHSLSNEVWTVRINRFWQLGFVHNLHFHFLWMINWILLKLFWSLHTKTQSLFQFSHRNIFFFELFLGFFMFYFYYFSCIRAVT